MAATAHVYEIFIHAARETVWDAITDPDVTERYFHNTRIESSFRAGEPVRFCRASDGTPAVEGTVEEYDPPNRLVITWRVLYDAAMSDEPPSRVEWTLTPANPDATVTRLTLRHLDLAQSPKTWASVRVGWVAVLDGMKTLLETGAPLPAVETAGDPGDADADRQWHRAQAVTANNSAWELLDGQTLAGSDLDEALARAHAAAYHWDRAAGAGPVNRMRAAWLLARVYAAGEQGALALHYADRSAALLREAGDATSDFDVVYAHEGRARALACLGRDDAAAEEHAAALSALSGVADDEDRAIATRDVAAGPWFGLAPAS